MLASEFDSLSLERKIQWVYLEGEFLMDIRYYEFKVNLYRVRGFLIEVFYHHKLDRIAFIRPLDSTSNRMKFYADQVKMPELLTS